MTDAMTTPADQSRTKSAYSLQWNRFRIVRPEEDRVTFRNRTGLGADELAGALVLDAGCGMGRYLRVAAEADARAVGLDLSQAVLAARDLTADLPGPGVGLVRGDLLRLLGLAVVNRERRPFVYKPHAWKLARAQFSKHGFQRRAKNGGFRRKFHAVIDPLFQAVIAHVSDVRQADSFTHVGCRPA